MQLADQFAPAVALAAVDPDWQQRFLADLVRIDSVNPETWPGGSGEANVAARVSQELSELGLVPETSEAGPGRTSVIARLPGTSPRTLLLEAHLDTVQAEGMRDPFSARVRDGRLHGRGACDDKASVTAFVGAVRALARAGVTPPVTVVLAAAAGEEFAGRGIRALMAAGLRADGAIVGEPTRLDVVVAHKGCVRAELHVHGRAAHSSRPETGANAVEAAATAITAMQAALGPVLAARAHPLSGVPTLAFTLIAGGVGINTIPADCAVRFDRRVIPGERPEDALGELRAALAAVPLPDGIRAEIRDPFLMDGPMALAPDAPLPQALLAAARRHRPQAATVGVTYGTDAGRIASFGVPCVVFGPGDIAQAHAAEEWVDLAQVDLATRIVLDAVYGFAAAG